MFDYVTLIIIPHVKEKRRALKLSDGYPAVVLFDVFKGQCQENLFELLEENHIFYILIPTNCTDQLQPMDLSVNKPAKDFLRQKFQHWYAQIICNQLGKKVSEAVDMRLSVMKPLLSEWAVEMHKYFKVHSDIIINGFHAAGITDILKE